MRIACPSCNATYQVPDEQLSEGRVVRCVRCATDWLPVVAVPVDGGEAERARDVQAAVPELPVEASVEALAEAPVRRMALDEDLGVTAGPAVGSAAVVAVPGVRRGPWLAIAWVVSVLAVIGGVAALVVWREAVMQGWPPSVRAYAGLGLVARP